MSANIYRMANDPKCAQALWDGLRERWPQLNYRTRIEHTTERQIVYPVPMQVPATQWRWQPISGLLRLRQAAFAHRWINLDDPVQRITYQRKLWIALVRVPYYWLCRITGRRYLGMEQVPAEMSITQAALHTETIDLLHYACRVGDYEAHIYCGYNPRTDTLYIRDRWEGLLERRRLQDEIDALRRG